MFARFLHNPPCRFEASSLFFRRKVLDTLDTHFMCHIENIDES